ncbi:ABC transporter permease subunit [Saccharospirillum salsuginis]|uniref:sn-glycerol-3-phosphate transport system permease protein UgpE n=1 Tax=Saccharospirillum salsuginis TaxID=418750 RepID=A0A918K5M3_9GAMM|nr:ABC transporter permease subunit [Saccharospirillum salsuginis]GGX47942.1 sn-glycerol-3-phosphate transport system permease protein UgpE [Saccharospirillum salsuginis]
MTKDHWSDHLILIVGVLFLLTPLWLLFASSTHSVDTLIREGLQWLPGGEGLAPYGQALTTASGFTDTATGLRMLINSMIMGVGFAVGKIIVSMAAAYALVYFRFPLATFLFWAIFCTLLLPLEVRIVPSYEVVSDLNLLNSYTGLIVPLIASATATFYFRQFYKTVPNELLEAATLDNAGPWRFFKDILVPLSRTMMAAIFIIMFVVGWNQYLWPLIMTTEEGYYTIVMGLKHILSVVREGRVPEYNVAFALVILAMLPPVAVVVLFQRWFIQGLVESEK